MKHQVLIINSSKQKSNFLLQLLQQLIKDDFWFWLLSSNNSLFKGFRENNWPCKINCFGWINNIGSLILLPYFVVINFCQLFWYKNVHQVKTVIFINWPEKIIFTPLARFLGLNILWLEMPNFDYTILKPWASSRYLKQSAKVKLICFTSSTRQELLELGVKEKNCSVVLPGINTEDYLYQDNIFNNISFSKAGGEKRFTIGTTANLDEQQRIEMLLQSLEICIDLDPNIQLVIINSGGQRKKISWLVKKMKLSSHVWLVSDQVSLKKWFNSFDLFIVANQRPDLEDLNVIIGAMANGLTVVGPDKSYLGDLSFNNQTAILTSMDSRESLARQIIRLQQDPKLRKQLSVNSKAIVDKYFLFDRVVNDFKNIFKNL